MSVFGLMMAIYSRNM